MRHPLAIILLLLPLSLLAQQIAVQTDTLAYVKGDTLQLSRGYLVPFSEEVVWNDQKVELDEYILDYQLGSLVFLDKWENGRVIVSYRYFLNSPKEELAIRKFRIVQDTANQDYVDVFIQPEETDDYSLWEESKIRKSGSLSRGLTLGNRQGLSVTSGLRLQLEGDLGDGIKIVGAITDENLPIQPDGTTQQISDFDKIFIQLSKDAYSITVGDYEVDHKGTYFADFYRNVQGMKIAVNNEQTKASVSGAVAKGKFHTNSLEGLEGVSGPYRLAGQNNERFFTVLAGSEKVYLNGKPLQRGENADYIINYNTAEVFFTAKHVITSATRIVIDFEYADFNFNRSLIFGQVEQKLLNDRLTVRASYGRDADNANAPLENELAYNQVRDSLAEAGDDTGLAVTSGAVAVGYTPDETRYARRDSVLGGQLYEVYALSRDPEQAIYQVFFSFVGAGNGEYLRDQSGNNANVYTWVGPDTISGQLRGDYAPIRQWALPRLLQVADASLQYQVSDNLRIYSETAVSSEDRNRLSPLNDDDNTGFANRTGLALRNVKLSDSIRISADVSHQWVDQRYTNLDRVYKAEYNRVWDLGTTERTQEQIIRAKTKVDYKRHLSVDAEAGMRLAGPGRKAFRQVYHLQSQLPKFLQGDYTFTHITTEDDSLVRDTRWTRHEGDVFFRINKSIRPGVELWLEDREEMRHDSLASGSFSFVDLTPYLRSIGNRKWTYNLSLNYRKERQFFQGAERDKFEALTYYARTQYRPSSRFDLQATTSFRVYDLLDTTFAVTGLTDTRVLNANVQSTYSAKNRLVYANFLYEVSSERVARKEVRFLEVNPGQGEYVWLDSLFNNDGIQQIDEFQLSPNPLVADFIRVLFPTSELFPTTRVSLTGNVRWDLTKLFERSKSPIKETVRNIRAISNFRISQSKERGSALSSYFVNLTNPFADSALLDASFNVRQDLSFFQNSKTGDLRFTYQNNQGKLFLATGDEFRGFQYWGANQRLSLDQSKTIEVETRLGHKFSRAERFSTRNYEIDFLEMTPKVSFQFSRKFRFSTGYAYKAKKNTNDSLRVDARVFMHKALLDTKWNLKGGNNIFAKVELVNVLQRGETSFAADYELTESLRPGFNALWQVFLTYYILENVELSFTYDGRSSPEIPVIHTGRVQVRALF